MKVDQSTELTPRKTPSQRRSQKRVESILDATATLLDDVGPDGVNTNSIADAAGIPVSSLYQYFPNKHSVLAAVAARHTTKVARLSSEFLSKLNPNQHWTVWLEELIELMSEASRESPGIGPLWNFMRAHPKIYNDTLRDILQDKLAIIPMIINSYRKSRGEAPLPDDVAQQFLLLTLEVSVPLISTTSLLDRNDPVRPMRRKAIHDVLCGLAKPYMAD